MTVCLFGMSYSHWITNWKLCF